MSSTLCCQPTHTSLCSLALISSVLIKSFLEEVCTTFFPHSLILALFSSLGVFKCLWLPAVTSFFGKNDYKPCSNREIFLDFFYCYIIRSFPPFLNKWHFEDTSYHCLQNLWSYLSHSSSERRNNFVSRWSEFFQVLAVSQLEWF